MNTYSIGAANECSDCPEGGHSDPGSPTCETCGPGLYYDESTSFCAPCPSSTFSSSGAASLDDCVACSGPGEWSDAGAAYCSTAKAGSMPNANRTGEEPCPKNTYSVGAEDRCAACAELGPSHHSEPGSAKCEACSPGESYDDDKSACLPDA